MSYFIDEINAKHIFIAVSIFLYMYMYRGVARIWQGGGGKNYFCQIWKFAMRFARGFGVMLLREFFLILCNLVRFGVYLAQILPLKKFLNYHFLYKNFKNYYFLYTKFKKLHFYIKNIYFSYTLAMG